MISILTDRVYLAPPLVCLGCRLDLVGLGVDRDHLEQVPRLALRLQLVQGGLHGVEELLLRDLRVRTLLEIRTWK